MYIKCNLTGQMWSIHPVSAITLRILIISIEERKKYIEEIFKHCKIDSILVITKTGDLERLQCPFEVLVIQDVGELHKGLKCLVSAVKMDLSLIDVYIIRNKAYYFFNFSVFRRK